MEKLPARSVEVMTFWPVRVLAALMVTPGKGTLPALTVPVISPPATADGACGEAAAAAGAVCAARPEIQIAATVARTNPLRSLIRKPKNAVTDSTSGAPGSE